MVTTAPRRDSALEDTELAPPPPAPTQPQIRMGFSVPLAGAGLGAGVYHGPVTVNGGQPAWMWIPAPAPPAAPLPAHSAYNGPGTLVANGVIPSDGAVSTGGDKPGWNAAGPTGTDEKDGCGHKPPKKDENCVNPLREEEDDKNPSKEDEESPKK
ncbi:hypothetical protein LTR78_003725 [Recurvomyces mirabilis]|uniref:Uncharacterized protein n=1 Tax=Recurvomyces mirabilis TaxID=574656 RepID=A0AAE0WR25_9PEZI|nr:hypothetical protein LTR78_003725 [Recurvomyces mirabilis]KAK5154837.1 hypothetical protein LTS14_006418 [Recurvomyces mirabilis]